MNTVLFKIAIGFYFLGTIFFLIYLVRRKEVLSRSTTRTTSVGFFFHTIALAVRMKEVGYIPLTNIHEAMAFFSWALVLTFLILEHLYQFRVLGSFVLPLAFIFLYPAGRLLKTTQALHPTLKSIWLGIHTTVSLLGIVALAIAFIAGLMYLIQESLLKSKRFNALYDKLPSLDVLDHLNQISIIFGFPLLTVGIITGALWAEYAWGSYWTLDPKFTSTFLTWLFYLAMLFGRLTMGWRARRAAYLAIFGFVGVLFSFLGVNFFLKGLHIFV